MCSVVLVGRASLSDIPDFYNLASSAKQTENDDAACPDHLMALCLRWGQFVDTPDIRIQTSSQKHTTQVADPVLAIQTLGSLSHVAAATRAGA